MRYQNSPRCDTLVKGTLAPRLALQKDILIDQEDSSRQRVNRKERCHLRNLRLELSALELFQQFLFIRQTALVQ